MSNKGSDKLPLPTLFISLKFAGCVHTGTIPRKSPQLVLAYQLGPSVQFRKAGMQLLLQCGELRGAR